MGITELRGKFHMLEDGNKANVQVNVSGIEIASVLRRHVNCKMAYFRVMLKVKEMPMLILKVKRRLEEVNL